MREARIRSKYRRLGGVVLALTNEPQSTRAWAEGADGEQRLGGYLDKVMTGVGIALHDRRLPRTRANIDHIIVGPQGVSVVDAKNYRGKVEKRDVGGWFRRDERLYVDGRDRSVLVEGLRRQVDVIQDTLKMDPAHANIAVLGALCFLRSDWSLLGKPLRFGELVAIWPKALAEQLRAKGDLTPEQIASVAAFVDRQFPPA